MGFLEKIFGSYSEKELKRIQPIVDRVLALEEEFRGMDDDRLREMTPRLKKRLAEGESLEGFLESRVFAQSKSSCIAPDASDAAGFRAYTERYKACLPVERAAAEALKL